MSFQMYVSTDHNCDVCDKCGGRASIDKPILVTLWSGREGKHVTNVHTMHITKEFAKYNKAQGRLAIL